MGDEADFDALAVIDAVGPMIGLPIAPDYRETVANNLKITAEFARILFAFPLDDATESASVFEA